MSRILLALLAFIILCVGGIVGWVTRGTDFGSGFGSSGVEANNFVQVSAPEQAQLVSIMTALEVPATPQSGLSGTRLVNVSAALSALQSRTDVVVEEFARRDSVVEAAHAEARVAFEQKEADLTALLAVERKDLLALVADLEGDVAAREAEIAAGQQLVAEIQQKYDGILGEVTNLQLERDALTTETERLSNLVSVSQERLTALGDGDGLNMALEHQELRQEIENLNEERTALQQTVLDLMNQVEGAESQVQNLSNEQQSGQRLLEALRLEGERLLNRQRRAEEALAPAESAVFEAQTLTEELRIEAAALRSEIAVKEAEKATILQAIGSFGAAIESSGKVTINGEPITQEAAFQTLLKTLEREKKALAQADALVQQLADLEGERADFEATVESRADQKAAILAAEARVRVTEAEAEVAAMQAKLLTEASEREVALMQELQQLKANNEAQIAQDVSARVAEALAASLNSSEAALQTQATADAEARFNTEKARLIEDIQAEANQRLEIQRAALIGRYNNSVEARAQKLAAELAQRLVEEGALEPTSTSSQSVAESNTLSLSEDLAPIDAAVAMAAIRERLYSRLVDASSNEFSYRPRVIGERLLLASNGLFPVGSPNLSREGQEELLIFGRQLETILADLDDPGWMIRVDGHADIKPYLFSPFGNWELSSERAVSVVEFLIENTNIDADRLMVAAFAEHQPLVEGDDEAAQLQNRRIEFKLVRR